MNIIEPINQNIPIWSMLCGDHALKHAIEVLNDKLIKEPDFFNELENNLRLEVFKSKRNWLIKNFGNYGSFGLIKFSIRDLSKFYTCFDGIDFNSFVKEYKTCYHQKKQFKIKNIVKSKNDINELYELMLKIENEYIHTEKNDVLNSELNNIEDISVALNRTLIMKNQNKYYVVDGTHRLSAYYWSKKLDKIKTLPENLYAFYIEKTYI